MFESRRETLLVYFPWEHYKVPLQLYSVTMWGQERPSIHLEKGEIILLNCSPVSQLYSECTKMFENTVSENLSSVASKAFLAEK